MHDADAGADERRDRAGLQQPERRQVDEAGQHSRHRRQLRRHLLPPVRRQEVGAPFEREVRPVFDQRLDADRPGGVAEPELDRGHRPEIPRRPQARAVAAGAAAVERRRGRAGAVRVAEHRLPRPVEADAAPQVTVAGAGRAGGRADGRRERNGCHAGAQAASACAGPAARSRRRGFRDGSVADDSGHAPLVSRFARRSETPNGQGMTSAANRARAPVPPIFRGKCPAPVRRQPKFRYRARRRRRPPSRRRIAPSPASVSRAAGRRGKPEAGGRREARRRARPAFPSPAGRSGTMSTTIAIPRNTASTFVVHLFGGGLADERYAVERFKAAADGDIRPWPGADGAAATRKGRRRSKRATAEPGGGEGDAPGAHRDHRLHRAAHPGRDPALRRSGRLIVARPPPAGLTGGLRRPVLPEPDIGRERHHGERRSA